MPANKIDNQSASWSCNHATHKSTWSTISQPLIQPTNHPGQQSPNTWTKPLMQLLIQPTNQSGQHSVNQSPLIQSTNQSGQHSVRKSLNTPVIQSNNSLHQWSRSFNRPSWIRQLGHNQTPENTGCPQGLSVLLLNYIHFRNWRLIWPQFIVIWHNINMSQENDNNQQRTMHVDKNKNCFYSLLWSAGI